MFIAGSGLFIFFSLLFHNVEGECLIRVPHSNRPLLLQKFGSKDIIIQNTDVIELNENEKIGVYCANGFRFIETDSNFSPTKPMLEISCSPSSLMIREILNDDFYRLDQDVPQCSDSMYAMFESKHSLPSCEQYSSYILGARLNTPIIKAALCYDLDNLGIKYVSYKRHESTAILNKHREFYPAGLCGGSFSHILKFKDYLFNFPSNDTLQQDLRNQIRNNYWLEIANFEYDNIIQTTTGDLKSSLKGFEKFFNIIWWKNLRSGNWRRFMQLLDNRTKNVEYNIYTGISGRLRVPVENRNCENVTSMELALSESAVIPQFIWTYVQSTSLEPAEEFIVIAYNSPYFEYFSLNSTIICNDMCDEIDWLQPIRDSRLVSALGRLYCCHPDEVAERLDGVPWKRSNQTTETTTKATEYLPYI